MGKHSRFGRNGNRDVAAIAVFSRFFFAPLLRVTIPAAHGQKHCDHGPSSLHAVYSHRTAHGIHDSLADRHTQTAPHDLTDSRIVLSLKRLKEPLLEFLADPDTGVADHKFKSRITSRSSKAFLHFQFDPALPGRIFYRIAHEVQQQLRHSELVAQHIFGQLIRHNELTLMIVRHDLRFHEIFDLLYDLPQIDPCLLQHHSPALDPAHIQHVVDQLQQMVARRLDLLQAVADPFGLIQMGLGNVGKPDDGVHRRPDIVRHIGEKSTLCVIRLTGLFQRCLQKSSLSEFLLSLLLNVGKSQQHLHGSARSDPHCFHLIVLRRACISGAEGECKSALFAEYFFHVPDIKLLQKVFAVLPGDPFIGKSFYAVRVAGNKYTPVFVHESFITPVDLIGISFQIDQVD